MQRARSLLRVNYQVYIRICACRLAEHAPSTCITTKLLETLRNACSIHEYHCNICIQICTVQNPFTCFNVKCAWQSEQCMLSSKVLMQNLHENLGNAHGELPPRVLSENLHGNLRRAQCAYFFNVVSCSYQLTCAECCAQASSTWSAPANQLTVTSKTKHIVFKLATLFFFEYTSRILYCLNKVAKLKEIILQINFTPLY